MTQPAWAQTAPAAAPVADSSPSDIVVTARRVEERLQDVPISITAFSQQQITARNIVSSGDLALYTPSLIANSRFGAEKTSFAIRGFNQDVGTGPSVGVYFADAPAIRAVAPTATGNGAGPGSFFDLQNVQVLKGPQGTLFGRNTSGGAVLLVPQKPTSRFEGYIEGSLGNYDLARIQAVVNAPISDTLRVRLGFDRETREGYIKNYSGIGPNHFDGIHYWAGRASVVWDVTPNVENYLVGTYSKSDTSGSMPRVFACNRAQAATVPLTALECNQVDRGATRDFYSGENAIINPHQTVSQWQIVNTTSWKASDSLTVKNIFSYGQFRENTRSTAYGENLQIVTGPQAGRNAFRVISQPAPGLNLAAESGLTEELQLQGRAFDDRLTWQAGAYLEHDNPIGYAGAIAATSVSCTNDNPFTGCTPFAPAAGAANAAFSVSERINKYAFQDYAAYSQATYKLTDQFSVTGGIRYTWDRYQADTEHLAIVTQPAATNPPVGYCLDGTRFGVRNSATNPGTFTIDQCHVKINGKSQAPTWLIDLDYKPTSDILIYAKYARGYRQGGIKTEGYGHETWAPEKIDDYEIGIKTSWRGPVRGTFNVAGFYNNFTNQQISSSATPSTPITPPQIILNAGKSTIKGIEVDGSLSPLRGLTIDGSYAYLDTNLKSLTLPPNDALFSNYQGSGARIGYPLVFTPKNKYTLTATYTLPLASDIGRISFGATFVHTDSQYASFQDTPAFLAGTIPYDYGLLPALNLVNLNASWNGIAGKPVDLSLFVTNLTKRKYYTATYGGYPSFGIEAGSVGEPRMIGVRLKYRFGK